MTDRYTRDWLAELAAWEDRPISGFAKAAHLRWHANGVRESLCGVSMKGDRIKRIFDLTFAAFLLGFCSPLFVIAAIAIKLDSHGPVFFHQRRAGRDNVSFTLLKFRTMYCDADVSLDLCQDREEEYRALLDGLLEGPRVTRVGRVLRRFSLDELPQLFNVVRGDMSLVGPRPLHASEAAIFAEAPLLDEDEEEQRCAVRPGLAGHSRVVFLHRVAGFQEMLRMDVEYARSRSLLSDLRFLVLLPVHLVKPPKRYR